MNKIISKKLFIKNNITTPKFTTICRSNFKEKDILKFLDLKKIKFPIVSKPVNEGQA